MKSEISLLEQRVILADIQRWVTKLGYEFEIHYRPGLENKAADALSRVSPQVKLSSLAFPLIVDVQLVTSQVDADPRL